MPIPSLPPLPPDLDWLIHMKPTLSYLDAFLRPPAERASTMPEGVHIRPFRMGNIFGRRVPSSLPFESTMTTDELMHEEGEDLLEWERPHAWEVLQFAQTTDIMSSEFREGATHMLLSGPCAGCAFNSTPCEQRRVGACPTRAADRRVYDFCDRLHVYPNVITTDGHLSERQTRLAIARHLWKESLQAFETHQHGVRSLCVELHYLWSTALRAYSDYEAGKESDAWSARSPLYLHPYIKPLPDRALLDMLCDERKTLHLLLLTMRHELGHFYKCVQAWVERASQRGSFWADDQALSDEQLLRLSARQQRGTLLWTTEPILSGSGQGLRRDGPTLVIDPACDAERLYAEFASEWYLPVYRLMIAASTCRWIDNDTGARCTRLLPPWSGQGGKPQYCDEHRAQSLREHARKRKQAQRERQRSGIITSLDERRRHA